MSSANNGKKVGAIAAPSSGRAKLVLTLLLALNILNIVDRNLISSFGPQITAELNLSDTQFGWLTGLIFVFFYAIMGLFVGRLADFIHRPRLITAGLVLWSALTVASGAAKNFLQLGIARLLVGVGEACLTPAAIAMIADLFPRQQRGLAASLYYLGVPLGAGASFVVAGIFGPKIGWRNCFYLLGILGLLFAPLVFFLRDPTRGAHDGKHAASDLHARNLVESLRMVLRVARQSPALGWSMLGAVFMHLPIGAAQFAQLWLVRERGFAAAEIAVTYGTLFIIFGTLGALLSGVLSDWYRQRFSGGRVRFLAIFLLLMTPLLLGYRFSQPGSILFYVGMCAGFISFMAMFGPTFATIQDLAPAKLRGITTALLLLATNLFGLGVGAILAGFLSDLFKSMTIAEPLTWALVCVDLLAVFTVLSFYIASVYWAREFGDPCEAKRSVSNVN